MTNRLYVIRDKVADESGPIFEAKNDGIAYRQFEHTVSKVLYRKELQLFCVGVIDHDNDCITIMPQPMDVTPSVQMEVENE